MAQISFLLTLLLFLVPSILVAQKIVAAQPFKGLVAPITQSNTSLYTITLNQNENLIIDIETHLSWHYCPRSFPRVSCTTPQCLVAQSNKSSSCHLKFPKNLPKQLCNTCFTLPTNPITNSCDFSQLTYTNYSISSTDGHNPLGLVTYNNVVLSCAPRSFYGSQDYSGVASLSRGPLSLLSQLANQNVSKKFGICLGNQGVAFFGDGPFYLLPPPGRNVTELLQFTKLVKSPIDNLGYYISLKGISVNLQAVKFSKTMLAFDQLGNGGVKLSTVIPYTKLRSPIYKALLKQFDTATSGIPRVAKVTPFDLCINTTNLGSTRVGLPVPQIDLQLKEGLNWTIFGLNSMKDVSDGVSCFAFVDGGETAQQAMVIGLYQMQQNLFLFDLVKSRLGFSSSLSFFRTGCGNFNFTSALPSLSPASLPSPGN